MNASTRRVAVLGGTRIPFARQNGPYARASNQDMLTATLEALVGKFSIEDEILGEVAAGGVLKHSRDFNLTREAVLGTRLDPHTPAYDVQQACGTGLEAAILVANKIALGQIDSGIAGGFDTTSDAPIAINEDLRQVLLEINRAKSNAARLKALAKLRPQQIVPQIPRNAEPRTGLSMGEHAAIMATEWGISREEQDELAVRSHKNLAAAYDTGFLDDLVVPFLGLERDQNLRPDTSVEKLAKLKPVFGGERGDDDRRQLDPAQRRRLGRAARQRGVGGGAQPARPGVHRRRPDRRGRPRPRARGPADGAHLRGAEAARAQRPRAWATSTSTRSTRRSPPRCCAR